MTDDRMTTMTGTTTANGHGRGEGRGGRGRWRRVRGATAAVAALATVVGALPVQAAAAAAPKAPAVPKGPAAPAATPGAGVPAYKTAGKPLKGTASSGQAPTLKPGVYNDAIGVGEKKYYGVDLDDVSDAYVSGFALPRPGSKVAYGDGIELKLESASGTDCGGGSTYTFGSDDLARPVGGYTDRRISRDQQCQEEGHYLFSIERVSDGASDPDPWPVEIRYMLEPGLKKGTVPDRLVPAPSTTPAPPTGETKQIKGGTGFNDATVVGAGAWKDRIVPGQIAWYRVPVEWGQQIFATVEFANAEKITDEDGYTTSGAGVAVYNTARGPVTDESATYDGEQVAAGVLTQRADYTNRVESDRELSAMRFAGWYYIAVGLHPAVGEFVDGGVDITLRVKLPGQREKGPEYAGDVAKAGFGTGEDAFDGGAGSASDTKKLIAYGAFGLGGALVIGLLVWMLAARRRAPADAVPAGHPAGGVGAPVPYGSAGYNDPHDRGPGGSPPSAW